MSHLIWSTRRRGPSWTSHLIWSKTCVVSSNLVRSPTRPTGCSARVSQGTVTETRRLPKKGCGSVSCGGRRQWHGCAAGSVGQRRRANAGVDCGRGVGGQGAYQTDALAALCAGQLGAVIHQPRRGCAQRGFDSAAFIVCSSTASGSSLDGSADGAVSICSFVGRWIRLDCNDG